MKTTILLLAASLYGAMACAQCTLSGKITDAKTGEPILFASVALYKDSVLITGTETDFDGNYNIAGVAPGAYELEARYVGYTPKRITDVRIMDGKANHLDMEISSEDVALDEVVVLAYRKPLVERSYSTSGSTMSSEEIKNLPTRNVSALKAATAGMSSDKTTSVRGSRSHATDYYIDGVRVRSGSSPGGGSADGPAIHSQTSSPKIPAGQLTAGEWSDLDNWETWTELLEEDFLPLAEAWEMAPGNRYTVEVRNENGVPVPNCRASLMETQSKVLWTALTDNNGRAELWAPDTTMPQSIILTHKGSKAQAYDPKPHTQGVNQSQLEASCPEATTADIFFVVDATGSMGDEINYLKAELEDAILRAERNLPGMELRTGALFYRDHNDTYLTRSSSLSPELDSTLSFIRQQNAGGGGDGPEAVEIALEQAIAGQDWDSKASARLIFLILDAPPHQTPEIRESLQQSIRKAAQMGIKVIPVTGSGIGKSTEYLMKAMAISTNGTYAFITNHSGIGGSHIEPTAGPYEVQFLNDLMVKLILENTVIRPCPEEEQQALQPVGKLNPTLLSRVNCFPNPATGTFYLRLEKGFNRLAIRTLEGQLLQEKEKLEKGDHEFNAENWAPGLYLLELHKGDEVAVEKLVVERRP